jgi:hypothetical protein
MSDPLDEAEKFTNMFLEKALQFKAKVPELTGLCLVCEDPTEGAFCSKECREDHERLEKINAIKGIR